MFAREKGTKTVMVGTACESTRHTIKKTLRAADMGFEYASILTPHYFAKQMNDAALAGYYEAVPMPRPFRCSSTTPPDSRAGFRYRQKR